MKDVTAAYESSVGELMAAVKSTEDAIRKRQGGSYKGVQKSGNLEDGEKILLQLWLDFEEFRTALEEIDASSGRSEEGGGTTTGSDNENKVEIESMRKLREMVAAGKEFVGRT